MSTPRASAAKRQLTSVDIDRTILERAKILGGVSTNKQIIDMALLEFVQRKEQKNLLDLIGKIQFEDGYRETYKQMRGDKTI